MNLVGFEILVRAQDVGDQEGRNRDSFHIATLVDNVNPGFGLTFIAIIIDVEWERIVFVYIRARVEKKGVLDKDDIAFCCLN